ncbi:MAG: hypothetical protein IMW97_05415 [Firmicutes bacterium]|nr:hypothetical protein [Candidatus Fermentithermobacillaceae bacterium]
MSQTPASSKVWHYVKAFVGAVLFVALVPVVSGVALWLVATYYPEKTAEFMAPVLKPLVSSYQAKDASEQEALKSRLAQIEQDMETLKKRVEESLARPATAEGTPGQATGPVEVRVDPRTAKLLSALDSLTVARVEYTMGNRGVALREVRLAQELLGAITDLPEDVKNLLDRVASELAGDSPAAGDWLSVLWHAVLREATQGGH